MNQTKYPEFPGSDTCDGLAPILQVAFFFKETGEEAENQIWDHSGLSLAS